MKKHIKRREAAEQIAEIMYASLQKFTEREQEKRVKDIQKIAAKARLKRS
jgi:hypothetical protein